MGYSFNPFTGTLDLSGGGSVVASSVTFTPAGNIAATNVQTAIEELDTEKQPIDADLTAIAGLTATTDNFIQSKSSAWASRTVSQVKTDLGISNVDNTSDANKPVSSATQTALDTKQALDSDLTTIAGLTATTDSFMQSKSSAWAARTVAQVKVDLGLTGTNSGDQAISDATITTTDITTNNFTTAKHGFVPKGTNVGSYLKDDGTWAAVSSSNISYFSTGEDGDVTISSNVSISNILGYDAHYNNLTINNGFTLTTGSFRIFVKGTLLNNGTISCAGVDGSNASVTSGGAGGSARAGAYLENAASNTQSTAGANGGTTTGAQGTAPTLVAVCGSATDDNTAGGGGTGGNGTSGTGGAPRQINNATYVKRLRTWDLGLPLSRFGTMIALSAGHPGCGGSSGGGDGTAGGGGGGGGGSGGFVWIAAKVFNNAGIITVKGGNGGTGGTPAGGSRGSGAGGGGGGGGYIYVFCKTKTAIGTLTVTGGTAGGPGAKTGTGTNGGSGQDGKNGKYWVYEADTDTVTSI